MDSLDLQVLQHARDWVGQGRKAWLATVVETWGSAPRPPGALLCLRDDGLVSGSVSGGCVEDDLIALVRRGDGPAKPALVRYGIGSEEAARFGLPCGGTLRLLLEPLHGTAWMGEVLRRTAGHERVARRLDLASGDTVLETAARADAFTFDGQCMRSVFGPRWRLLVIGAGQLARALARLMLSLDFEVTCCDPREEYHLTWDVPHSRISKAMPDDLLLQMQLDLHSAVVALTHDAKLDDMALLEALKSPAFYVGALGSRANTAKRRERLALFDLSTSQIDRLHGPVGLDLGGNTPAEIALAIAAEIVAVKNGVALAHREAPASRS
jgi:xanthine dehydrogenase accessory factor